MDKLEIVSIGVVRRESPEEDIFDRSLITRVVLKEKHAHGYDTLLSVVLSSL